MNKTARVLALLACATAILSYSVLLASKDVISYLAAREALLEHLGAFCFLVAACLSLARFIGVRRRHSHKPGEHGYAYLLLAIFFLVAFGEEISWGTLGLSRHVRARLFPMNVQEEFNLHNLTAFDEYWGSGERKTGIATLVTANRLFDCFMIAAFLLVPMAARRIPRIKDWLAEYGIPVVPVILSLGLITNWILTLTSESLLLDDDFMHGAVSEIREFNYAFLCLLGTLYLYLAAKDSELGMRV